MMKENKNLSNFPLSFFSNDLNGEEHQWKGMTHILKKLLPENIWSNKKIPLDLSSQELPIFKWIEPSDIPGELIIHLLCKELKSLRMEDLILSLLRMDLHPSKPLEISAFRYTTHFSPYNRDKLFLAEAVIHIESQLDLFAIQQNLPLISKKITQATHSPAQVHYLLETKIPGIDEKISQVHILLFEILKKFPNQLDVDILLEFNRLLILSTKDFRNQRSSKHITHLVCSYYLIGKSLARAIRIFPEKRHLQLRFTHTKLQYPFGEKQVVGLVIGIYLLDVHESFEEKHILHAVQKLCPDVQNVKGSFYCYQNPQEEVRKLYVELEKKYGNKLSLKELKLLRRSLATELKGCVEKLAPSMLMIRNEEEALKNVFILSQELHQIDDIPQVSISFEGQDPFDLIFKVILVRVLQKKSKSLEDLVSIQKGFKGFIQRTQIVGYLRKKYPKEASILHIHIPKESSVLRADSSVNLYSARKKVVFFLEQHFGQIRDYNGGMILKQGELLAEIREHFKTIPQNQLELLEEFFYRITPIEMQAILPAAALVELFSLFFESLEINFSRREQYYYKILEKDCTIFTILRASESSLQECLESTIKLWNIEPKLLISSTVRIENTLCLGYIYQGTTHTECQKFQSAIEFGILKWFERIQSQQTLRLNFLNLPSSLDPRLSGEQFAGIIFKMLYEGLMRIGKDGKPTCAIAESVTISKDLEEYTFILRESYWSDGTLVSAEDFEYAWKKILDPNFKTPFAYLFYPIKNAQAAKEGFLPSKEIGIRVPNQKTLVVKLEHSTPYFLELTAHALYSPINHLLDQTHPNWSSQEGNAYVCNGPFCVKKVQADQSYEFTKNERYWDAKEVKLERIFISKTNPYTALEMYQKDEIDWLGRPISPWEPFFADDKPGSIKSGPPGFVYWCVLNTERFPFSHVKFRQALGLALNRKEIIQALAYPAEPATAPLPMAYSQCAKNQTLGEDCELAMRLFCEFLQELKLKKEDLPVFTFLHMKREARKKVAEKIIQQWEAVFGIKCRLEECEWPILFTKLTQGDFQIGEMSWFSPINDPHYTLDAFKYRKNSVNFAKWENKDFQRLLNIAASEINSADRLSLLASAEKLLMNQMPVIPIFYDTDLYKKKSYLQEVYQRTEQVDFKWAHISRDLSSNLFHGLNLANSKPSSYKRRAHEPKIISISENMSK